MTDLFCIIFLKKTKLFLLVSMTLFFSITTALHAQQPELFIESVYSPEKPYVQQAVRYTIRLWRDSHLQQGYFLTPDIPDTILLEDQQHEIRQVKKNGREYEVLEQHYFLIPQTSGVIKIPEPVFSSRELFVKGKALSLNVKPRPQNFLHKNWLIAKAIQIEQMWTIPERPLQTEEALERTIIIKGVGIVGAQLPKITLTEHASLASAEDMLTEQNFFDNTAHSVKNGELYGQRSQKIRYIAAKPGIYTIPETTIFWLNSDSGEIEKELIPGRLISVEQGVVINKNKKFVKPDKNIQKTTHYNEILSILNTIERQTFYIILLLSMIILLRRKYRQLNIFLNHLQHIMIKSYHIYKLQRRMHKACKQSDYFHIKAVLLEWAIVLYPERKLLTLVSLSALTENKSIRKTLAHIDRGLYGNSKRQTIDSKTRANLMSFMRTVNKRKNPDNKLQHLPQLWQHHSGY